jgi:hypothetical protein
MKMVTNWFGEGRRSGLRMMMVTGLADKSQRITSQYDPAIGVASFHCVLNRNVARSKQQIAVLDKHGEAYRCLDWLNVRISTYEF